MTQVRIHHPAWGRETSVPAHLYPGRLAPKGWQLADEPPPPAPAEPPEDPEPLDEKTQLRQILTDRGVGGWDGRTGLKKLRQLIEGSE